MAEEPYRKSAPSGGRRGTTFSGGRREQLHRATDTTSYRTEEVALFLFYYLLIGAVIAGLVLIPQHLHHNALQRPGWFQNGKPDPSIMVGLNLPPLGIGMSRDVRQQVAGGSWSGLPFQAFQYSNDFWGGEQRVICIPLPHSMSPFHLFHGSVSIPEVQGLIMNARGPIKAASQDATYGRAIIDAVVPLLPSLGCNRPAIDHDQLVLLDVNQELRALQLAVEWLAAVHAAITGFPTVDHGWEPSLPYVFFTNHPNWEFVGRDNSPAQHFSLSTPGGRVFNTVRCLRDLISFIRITHQWRTAIYARQIAVVQSHIENPCGFWVSSNFTSISVNMADGDDIQNSEPVGFNERFTVCCWSPRFVSSVFSPRQFKFFLRFPALPSGIGQDGMITARSPEWPLERVETILFLLHGSFGRIPDFVWCELDI